MMGTKLFFVLVIISHLSICITQNLFGNNDDTNTSVKGNASTSRDINNENNRKQQVVKLKKLFNESYQNFELFLTSTVMEKVYSFTNYSLLSNLKMSEATNQELTNESPYTMIHYCIQPLTLASFQLAVKNCNNCRDNGYSYKFLYWVPISLSGSNKNDENDSERTKYLNDISMLNDYFSNTSLIILDVDALTSVFGSFSNQLLFHYNRSAGSQTPSSFSRSVFVDSLALYTHILSAENEGVDLLVTEVNSVSNANKTTTSTTKSRQPPYLWMIDVGVVWVGDIAKVLLKWNLDEATRSASNNVDASVIAESSLHEADYAAAGCINSRDLIQTILRGGSTEDDILTSLSANNTRRNTAHTSDEISAERVTRSNVASASFSPPPKAFNKRRNIIRLSFEMFIRALSGIRETFRRRSQILSTRLRRLFFLKKRNQSISRQRVETNHINDSDSDSGQLSDAQDISLNQDVAEPILTQKLSMPNSQLHVKTKLNLSKQKSVLSTLRDSTAKRSVGTKSRGGGYDDAENEDDIVVCHSDIARYNVDMLKLMELQLRNAQRHFSSTQDTAEATAAGASGVDTTERNSPLNDHNHTYNGGDSNQTQTPQQSDSGSESGADLLSCCSDGSASGDITASSLPACLTNAATLLWRTNEKSVTELLDIGLYDGLLAPGFVPLLFTADDANDDCSNNGHAEEDSVEFSATDSDIAEATRLASLGTKSNAFDSEDVSVGASESLTRNLHQAYAMEIGEHVHVTTNNPAAFYFMASSEGSDTDSSALDAVSAVEKEKEKVRRQKSEISRLTSLAVSLLENNSNSIAEHLVDHVDSSAVSVPSEENGKTAEAAAAAATTTTISLMTISTMAMTFTEKREELLARLRQLNAAMSLAEWSDSITKAFQKISDFLDIYYPLYMHDHSQWRQLFHEQFRESYMSSIANNQRISLDKKNDSSDSFDSLWKSKKSITKYLKSIHLNSVQSTSQFDFDRIQEKFVKLSLPDSMQQFTLTSLTNSMRPGILFRNLSVSKH